MIEDSNDTLMPSLHVICIASLKIMSHGIVPELHMRLRWRRLFLAFAFVSPH